MEDIPEITACGVMETLACPRGGQGSPKGWPWMAHGPSFPGTTHGESSVLGVPLPAAPRSETTAWDH